MKAESQITGCQGIELQELSTLITYTLKGSLLVKPLINGCLLRRFKEYVIKIIYTWKVALRSTRRNGLPKVKSLKSFAMQTT